MKFLVFTFHNGGSHEGCSFTELAKLTSPSKEEYAKYHGYDFYCQTEDFSPDRAIGWAKIDILNRKLPDYDWLLYVECDAMIMNPTIRLENLIDDNYDVIISNSEYRDNYQGVNTGVMLVKSSDWSIGFFEYLSKKSHFFNRDWYEQGAIINEVRDSPVVRSHFKLVHNRLFNSYYHRGTPEENFVVGDFICHSAGTSNESRQALFTELRDKRILIPEDHQIRTPFF